MYIYYKLYYSLVTFFKDLRFLTKYISTSKRNKNPKRNWKQRYSALYEVTR